MAGRGRRGGSVERCDGEIDGAQERRESNGVQLGGGGGSFHEGGADMVEKMMHALLEIQETT